MSGDSKHSDDLLLEDLRKGCVAAFETIFNQHWEKLYRTARFKLRSHEEAEEVIQNIFSALWEKRETLLITNLTFYLNTALRNRILNVMRSKVTQRKYWEYYKNFIPHSHDSTCQDVEFGELNDAVDFAVNQLPEKSRRVFQLSRMEGLSNAEIAKLLNVSEKAIEYHLTKSLKVLRLRLKDYITVYLMFMLTRYL